MRRTSGIIAIGLGAAAAAAGVALAGGSGAALAQQQEAQRPATAVAIPQFVRPPEAVSRPSALTAQQCAQAGGSVVTNDAIASVCKSNAYCITVDARGNSHRVCLSAQ